MKTRFTITLAIALAAILFWSGPTAASANNYGHGGYGGNVHCVHLGETLWGIALNYGTTAHAIAYANGLMNPNYVRAGMCLRIPAGGGYGGGYYGGYDNGGHNGYAKKPVYNGGHNGYNGYDNHNVPVSKKPVYNGGYVNDYKGGHNGGYSKGCHWVKWGETLSSIAWANGTTTWALAQANGIWNQNWIRAGMCLTIPGHRY